MTILLHFVPTGEHSCRLEWMMTQPGREDAPSGIAWSAEEPIVFRQDRMLIESAQRARMRQPPATERSVEADFSTLLVRRIVALAAAGRWEEERGRLLSRRIVKVRA